MTAQASDRITIDGIGWRLLGEPLEEYLSENFQEYPFVAPHTANWRGYTAEWRIQDAVIGEPVQPGRLFVPSGLRAIESLHALVDALAGTVNHYASAWVQPEEDWEVSVFVGPSNFRGEVGFQVSMFSMDPVPEPDFVEPDNDGHVWEDLEETIEAHIHAAWNEAAGLGLAVALDHLDEAVSLLDAYSDPDPDMQERVVDTAGHVLATLQVILAHVEEAYGGDWAS